ncbi:RNA-binding protein [Candidatus Woesearchaeota archaeon]|nr:RNA-binding protein [Candidatus Woesearchaeota archaeon]
MGELLVKDKDIVVPGQDLATGMDFLPAAGTYRDNDKIVATQLGSISLNGRLIKIIPLNGRYVPKRGDTIIGKIKDMNFSNWFVDIGYANDAVLSSKEISVDYIERGADISQYYDLGEYIVAKISNVSKLKLIDLTMRGPGLRKLSEGRIIKVSSVKVPRIIGKEGSMISMVKELTECKIMVGQNGLIWINGPDGNKEVIAVEAIEMISEKTQTSNLTERVKEFLEKRIKENV